MSYFGDQGGKDDPWGSYGNAPSYSFGDQPESAYQFGSDTAPPTTSPAFGNAPSYSFGDQSASPNQFQPDPAPPTTSSAFSSFSPTNGPGKIMSRRNKSIPASAPVETAIQIDDQAKQALPMATTVNGFSPVRENNTWQNQGIEIIN